MRKKLLIAVLGSRNSGKSSSWYSLFGHTVRSGWKEVIFGDEEYTDVYLINGSPQERGFDVDEYIVDEGYPDIVLCSIQYVPHGVETLQWFHDNGYSIYVQWLNPGYRNTGTYPDSLGFATLFNEDYTFTKEDGKATPPIDRVKALKDRIVSWAQTYNLVKQYV